MEVAADTFTLRISFTGLCAFVPRGEDAENPERMDVLLVDSKKAYGEYEEHRPILVFSLKNLPGLSADYLGATEALWEIAQEDMVILIRDRKTGDEKNLVGPIKYVKGRKPGDRPEEDFSIEDEEERLRDFAAQQADFSWLPEMKSVIADAAQVRPDILDGPLPKRVTGRVRLSQGYFGSHQLGGYFGEIIVAHFCPQASKEKIYKQAIAHWAGADIPISSAFDVIIRLTKFGHPDLSKDLVLRAVPNEKLEVKISNLCCGYSGYEKVGRPEPDSDFEYYYVLSSRYLGDLQEKYKIWPIPIPMIYPAFPTAGPAQAGGADPIRCSGVAFSITPLPKA